MVGAGSWISKHSHGWDVAFGDLSMTHVPHWIGPVGFVLMMVFCGAFLGGALWLAISLLIPCFALVIIESRYERGLTETREG